MDNKWYVCKKYPDYSINKQGDMRNNKTGNRLTRQIRNDNIHLYYCFKQDETVYNKAIRFLVAEQFIPNPKNKKYVIYIDNDPQNCCVENLRWSNHRTYLKMDEDVQDEYSKWYPWEECSKYDINKNGQMRNHETYRILKPSLAYDGYLYYSPRVNGKVKHVAAHICVAKQFIPNPEGKSVVNHIDENRQNCNIKNLEWVTHRENSRHATSQERIREKKEKPINEYDLNGCYIRTWKSAKYFYDFYNLDFAAAGGGRTLKRAAKNNLDFDNQMIINFGRIFRYYENDTENIRINCTQRSLARADNPFSNQKVPEEYLYVPIDAIVIHKEKLIEMLNWRFLTPEHKMAIEYGIECIEKCNKD